MNRMPAPPLRTKEFDFQETRSMMRRSSVTAAIAAAMVNLALMFSPAFGQTATAGECAAVGKNCCRVCCLPTDTCCCADTYCPKPLPCVQCEPMCCPDCYCAKPLPVVCCEPMCCPDTYCRKPFPDLCYGPPPVRYTCGPHDHCHSAPACVAPVPSCAANIQPAKTTVAPPVSAPEAKKVLRITVR